MTLEMGDKVVGKREKRDAAGSTEKPILSTLHSVNVPQELSLLMWCPGGGYG